ncbi:MAG: hypothetical protein ACI9IL_000467 [Rickettsiales bacterium]|jgi:hypothetical protein
MINFFSREVTISTPGENCMRCGGDNIFRKINFKTSDRSKDRAYYGEWTVGCSDIERISGKYILVDNLTGLISLHDEKNTLQFDHEIIKVCDITIDKAMETSSSEESAVGRFKSSRSAELSMITEASSGNSSNTSEDNTSGGSQESKDLRPTTFCSEIYSLEGKSTKSIVSL